MWVGIVVASGAHLKQLDRVAGACKQSGPALDLGLARTLHHHVHIVGKLLSKVHDALQHGPVLGARSGWRAYSARPAAWPRHMPLEGLVHEQLQGMAKVRQVAVRLCQLGRLACATADGRG